MAELPDPGGYLVQPAPTVTEASYDVLTLGANAPIPGLTVGLGNHAALMGVYVDMVQVLNEQAEIKIPGYALRRGDRILTLVGSSVQGVRNIITAT